MAQVRKLQIQEAERALDAAKLGQQGAVLRRDYYRSRGNSSAAWMEYAEESLFYVANFIRDKVVGTELIGSLVFLFPKIRAAVNAAILNVGGKGEAEYGGDHVGNALSAGARSLNALAEIAKSASSALGKRAGYVRRGEEWNHQAELAENDIEQYERQIEAARLRVEIANEELANHQTHRTHAAIVATYLIEKFTNQELYEWMIEELSELHEESYLLALDLARQVECCFHYERLPESFTQFVALDSWDDLHKGLTAAERLQQDLRRMESAWLNQNSREYELTRHISLSEIDPVALIRLRQEGICCFHLPEALFDADHPGHYCRRIKTVSLSIPCVSGPYTSINARLSLDRSEVRISPTVELSEDYPRQDTETDTRFRDIHPGSGDFALSSEMTAIVTSGGQADSGLFETNLRDERYLPFEGAGAISTWRLELPRETNRFDPASISDIVLHLRYTAREGDSILREAAWNATVGAVFGTSVPPRSDLAAEDLPASGRKVRLFSVRHEFPDAWHRFFSTADGQSSAVLDLQITREKFPYMPLEARLTMSKLQFVWVTKPDDSAEGLVAHLSFIASDDAAGVDATSTQAAFTVSPQLANLAMNEYAPAMDSNFGHWKLQIPAAENGGGSASIAEVDATTGTLHLIQERVVDLFMLVSYAIADQ